MNGSKKSQFSEMMHMLQAIDLDSFYVMAHNLKVMLIVLDQDLRLQYGNDVFFEMVGWSPNEVLGQDYVNTFIPAEMVLVVRSTLREIINKQVSDYGGSNLVMTKRHGTRSVNWNSVHLCSSDGTTRSMLCIGIDITENSSLKDILRRAALEKSLILDHIKEPVFFANENGCVLEANQFDLLDTNLEDTIGSYCYKLLYNSNRPCAKCSLPRVMATGQCLTAGTVLLGGSTWKEKVFLLKEDGINPRKIMIMLSSETGHKANHYESTDHKKQVKTIFGRNEIGIFSTAMREVMKQAEILHRDRSVPVLIEGETGTGKELVARYIHFGPEGSAEPFIDINCAAITPTIFESELFGYEGGAFTGGRSGGQKGKLDIAQGGTLFLDEIGEIPVSIQAKLLRVIQEKEYYRVGGLKKQDTDVRLICATNVNLEKSIQEGSFRKDLFYRLEAVRIHIPPLRKRLDDILPLAELFLKQLAAKKGKQFQNISKEAEDVFLNYPWPGNIRQLKNTIERIVLMWDDTTIRLHHLEFLNKSLSPYPDPVLGENELALPEEHLDLEKLTDRIILKALDLHNGNKTATARYLNISRRALTYRLDRLLTS